MRKYIISGLSLLVFVGCYFLAIYIGYTTIKDKWVSYLIGAITFLVVSIFMIIFAKKKIVLPAWASGAIIGINGAAAGLIVVGILLHIEKVYESDFGVILLTSFLICLLTYVLYYLMMSIPRCKKRVKPYTILYIILMIIAALCLIKTQYIIYVGVGYFMMIFMLIGSMLKAETDTELWMHMCQSSIGAVAIIAIVALVILSEGDIGDVGDIIPDIDLPTSKKNNIDVK